MKYNCDQCNTICDKVYGFNINGAYKQFCSKCASLRK